MELVNNSNYLWIVSSRGLDYWERIFSDQERDREALAAYRKLPIPFRALQAILALGAPLLLFLIPREFVSDLPLWTLPLALLLVVFLLPAPYAIWVLAGAPFLALILLGGVGGLGFGVNRLVIAPAAGFLRRNEAVLWWTKLVSLAVLAIGFQFDGLAS